MKATLLLVALMLLATACGANQGAGGAGTLAQTARPTPVTTVTVEPTAQNTATAVAPRDTILAPAPTATTTATLIATGTPVPQPTATQVAPNGALLSQLLAELATHQRCVTALVLTSSFHLHSVPTRTEPGSDRLRTQGPQLTSSRFGGTGVPVTEILDAECADLASDEQLDSLAAKYGVRIRSPF